MSRIFCLYVPPPLSTDQLLNSSKKILEITFCNNFNNSSLTFATPLPFLPGTISSKEQFVEIDFLPLEFRKIVEKNRLNCRCAILTDDDRVDGNISPRANKAKDFIIIPDHQEILKQEQHLLPVNGLEHEYRRHKVNDVLFYRLLQGLFHRQRFQFFLVMV